MTSETSRTQEDVTVASRGTALAFPNLLFSRYHGDLRVQIFLDQARRGRPTHFLRGATLDPPLTVAAACNSAGRWALAGNAGILTGITARFWHSSINEH